MPNIYKVFGLNNDFSLDELKNSYNNLINQLNNDLAKSEIEKEILLDKYKQLYKEAKFLYKQNQYDKLRKLDGETENQQINLFDRIDNNRINRFNLANTYGFGNNSFDSFNDLFNYELNRFNRIDNFFDNLDQQTQSNIKTYSYGSSYKSTLNDDGSKTIIESKYENKNGEHNKVLNAYKKMANGEVVQFTEDEMKELEKEQNHYAQIKN
jgi:hypothetical protein